MTQWIENLNPTKSSLHQTYMYSDCIEKCEEKSVRVGAKSGNNDSWTNSSATLELNWIMSHKNSVHMFDTFEKYQFSLSVDWKYKVL